MSKVFIESGLAATQSVIVDLSRAVAAHGPPTLPGRCHQAGRDEPAPVCDVGSIVRPAARAQPSLPLRILYALAVTVPVVAIFVLALRERPARSAEAEPPAASPLAPLAAKLTPLHKPLPPPQPGDWRDGPGRDEPGQSFRTWRRSDPVRATGKRRVIYTQVIGAPNKASREIMALAGEFLALYYGLPVKHLPPVEVDENWPYYARRTHTSIGHEQLLTTYILHHVLKPNLPDDAAVLIGLTQTDLWPGSGWNFVFGQASIHKRVGVWSLARYGDPTRSKAARQRCLLRTLKVASHEAGHMFSIEHCTALALQHVRVEPHGGDRPAPARALSRVRAQGVGSNRCRSAQALQRPGGLLHAPRPRGGGGVLPALTRGPRAQQVAAQRVAGQNAAANLLHSRHG